LPCDSEQEAPQQNPSQQPQNLPQQTPPERRCEGCGEVLVEGATCFVCAAVPMKKNFECTDCGEILDRDAQFCFVCGKVIDSSPPLKNDPPQSQNMDGID